MTKYNPILIGNIYGRWKVIEKGKNNFWNRPMWFCECQCGSNKIKLVSENSLKNGSSQSCGCLQKEATSILGKLSKKYNRYDLSGEFGIGYTNKGEEFYFDLEDYDLIYPFCWSFNDEGYLEARNPENKKLIQIHRLVMNYPSSFVDHENQNKSDNRKEHLRFATNSENLRNSKIRSNNKTGYTGVSKISNFKWRAYINLIGHKQLHLGTYNNIVDAIVARLKAEKKYFGEFAPQRYLFAQYGIG